MRALFALTRRFAAPSPEGRGTSPNLVLECRNHLHFTLVVADFPYALPQARASHRSSIELSLKKYVSLPVGAGSGMFVSVPARRFPSDASFTSVSLLPLPSAESLTSTVFLAVRANHIACLTASSRPLLQKG